MKALRITGIALIIVLVAMLRTAGAQNPSIQGELLMDWSNLKTTMDKIANEMPDDKYDFKPTPAQQSFGERTVHIAQVNVGLLPLLGGNAPKPIIDAKATTKVAAIKAMDESFDYGTALIKAQTDQTMMQAVEMALSRLRAKYDEMTRTGVLRHCQCNDPNCPTFFFQPYEAAHELQRLRDEVLRAFREAYPAFRPHSW